MARTNQQEELTMPRRAYSYQRVSQAKKVVNGKEGDSLARQDDFAERVCAKEGWTLDDSLVFIDRSRSGFHGHNRKPTAALTRFLDLVERGKITRGSVLIVENIDRLSREEVDVAYDLFRGILRAGVWIATEVPQRVYKSESGSLMDLMEPLFLMYLAHAESLKKSERVTHAWETQREQARAERLPGMGWFPQWLCRSADGTGFEVIADRAAEVLLIARLSREGKGCGEIARMLNDAGQTALTRKGVWRGAAVYQLLASRTLLGEYQPHRVVAGKRVPEGPPIPAFYPAIMTEEVWLDTRAALRRRKCARGRPSGPARVNLLVGLVYDVSSGRRMSLQCVGSHGKRVPYLSIGQVAGCARVRYDDVAEAVIETLAMLRPADVLPSVEGSGEKQKRIAELNARHTAILHRLGKLQAAAADMGADGEHVLPAIAQLGAELRAVAAERERLQLEVVSGRAEALSEVQSLAELRHAAAGQERRELDERIRAALPLVVKRIDVATERIHRYAQVVKLTVHLHSGKVREVVIDPRVLPQQ